MSAQQQESAPDYRKDLEAVDALAVEASTAADDMVVDEWRREAANLRANTDPSTRGALVSFAGDIVTAEVAQRLREQDQDGSYKKGRRA